MSLVFGFPNFPLTGYAVPHKDFNEFMDSGEIESSHDSLLSGVNAHVSPSPFVTGLHGNILKARRQTKPVIREVLPRLASAVEDPFVIEVQRFKDVTILAKFLAFLSNTGAIRLLILGYPSANLAEVRIFPLLPLESIS